MDVQTSVERSTKHLTFGATLFVIVLGAGVVKTGAGAACEANGFFRFSLSNPSLRSNSWLICPLSLIEAKHPVNMSYRFSRWQVISSWEYLMQLEAIERRTTVDLVVDRIARVIKDQKLAAGSRLPGEHQLVEQLQVSRPVLREALARLPLSSKVDRDRW